MKKACKYCVFYEDGKCEDSKGPDYCCDEFLLDEALFQGEESNPNEIQNEEDKGNGTIKPEVNGKSLTESDFTKDGSTDTEILLQSSTLEKRSEELEKPKEISVDRKDKKIIITIDLSSLFE